MPIPFNDLDERKFKTWNNSDLPDVNHSVSDKTDEEEKSLNDERNDKELNNSTKNCVKLGSVAGINRNTPKVIVGKTTLSEPKYLRKRANKVIYSSSLNREENVVAKDVNDTVSDKTDEVEKPLDNERTEKVIDSSDTNIKENLVAKDVNDSVSDKTDEEEKSLDDERNGKDPIQRQELSQLLCLVLNGIYILIYGMNKGISVSCLLLMIVFIPVAGDSSMKEVCSDSNDLEVRTSGPLKVGNDMKLICRHNCTNGTPRWDKDKPVGSKLTYNGCVQRQYINKITLDNHSNEYNLIFNNVTFADINSSYTCHYGYVSKQIRPIEDYEVLPTDESINKQSVYESNVLNGTLEFKKVYPLPECVLYCDEKRQKEIPICKTCKIWKRNFYKVKLIFNIDLINIICREENVSVRCAVGRNHFTYGFSKLPKRRKNHKEPTGILIGFIICVIVLFGLFVLMYTLYKLYKRGAFRRCWRDRNVETLGNQYYQPERSPDHGNNSQNKRITFTSICL